MPTNPRYTADGRGMLRRDAGLYVLHLQGTSQDMARQHGELLADEIRQGVLPFMADFLTRQVQTEGSLLARWKSQVASKGLALLSALIARNAPTRMRRELYILAEAAGMDATAADQALAVPDTMMWLVGMADRAWRTGLSLSPAPIKGSVGFGCSGVIALPTATHEGDLLHARNLDYDGIGTFDAFPTVAFCKPCDGQAYAWIASAGVHTAGLTGFNESGLFLGSNTSPTTDVSLRGKPFFALNDAVVRKATNLDDAVRILDSMRAVSGYNVLLSHGPSGEGVVAEYSAGRLGIRKPLGGCIAATNHYLHQSTRTTVPHVSLVDSVNTRKRYAQLRRRLARHYGHLEVKHLIDMMRAQEEHPTGAVRPLGDVVCNYLNLSSVVANVTQRQLWITCDPAPSALGRYVRMDFDAELENFGQDRSYALDVHEAAASYTGPAMDGLQAYMRGHQHNSYDSDPAAAYDDLLVAEAQLPDEPRIDLALALLALRLDRLDVAERRASRYLQRSEPWDSRRYRAHLVRAWVLQLQGHDDAAACHLAAAEHDSPHVDDADWEIRHWRCHRFGESDRQGLHIELFNAKRLLL